MVEHHEYRLQPEVTVRQYSSFFSSIYVVKSEKGSSNTDVSFPVLAAGSWRCEEYWQKGLWKSVVSWTCIFTLNPDGGIQKYTNSFSVSMEHALLGTRTPANSTDWKFHGRFRVWSLMANQKVVGASKAPKSTSMQAKEDKGHWNLWDQFVGFCGVLYWLVAS